MSQLYRFEIQDFHPHTLPFGRLVGYYQELSRLFNLGDDIHLLSIDDGSHSNLLAVEDSAAPQFMEKIDDIKSGKEPAGYRKINEMLGVDHTSAELLREDRTDAAILRFPGQSADQAPLEAWDEGSLLGHLHAIIAVSNEDAAKVRLRTQKYGIVICDTDREVAKDVASEMFALVRARGRIRWRRTEGNEWVPKAMMARDFIPVQEKRLDEAVALVRSYGVNWPADPIGDMARLNENE